MWCMSKNRLTIAVAGQTLTVALQLKRFWIRDVQTLSDQRVNQRSIHWQQEFDAALITEDG